MNLLIVVVVSVVEKVYIRWVWGGIERKKETERHTGDKPETERNKGYKSGLMKCRLHGASKCASFVYKAGRFRDLENKNTCD